MDTVGKHVEFLHENIFQTKTKWPHYNRLLKDLGELADQVKPGQKVVILERSYVFGGNSLFAPLFTQGDVTVVDCEVKSTEERAGYQAHWTDDPRCIKRGADYRASIQQTGLPDHCADFLLIPNVVHHVADQVGMFKEMARLLKPEGKGYLFEALVRELHQIPDDYVRYTPWGFQEMLGQQALKMTTWKPAGGPFESIAYSWVQALQYIPEDERKEKEEWFFTKHFPELMMMDEKYTKNHFRKHTSFPVAYSIFFEQAQ